MRRSRVNTPAVDDGQTQNRDRITSNRPVVVAGSPALRLAITVVPSGETRYATYVGGSGTVDRKNPLLGRVII